MFKTFTFIITARIRSLGQGNVFTPVCQVILFTGGVHPLVTHAPQADTPILRDGNCSGWYASYWNAFLLTFVLTL